MAKVLSGRSAGVKALAKLHELHRDHVLGMRELEVLWQIVLNGQHDYILKASITELQAHAGRMIIW